jgi:hypothetical protein
LDLSDKRDIAIETSIDAGKALSGGLTTFNYPDSSGVTHAFI